MYKIIVKKKAQKFIDKLPKKEKIRIVAEIQRLPNGEDIKPLKGHKGLYRLCKGAWKSHVSFFTLQNITRTYDISFNIDICYPHLF